MELFISPSSLGYLFAAIVSFITAWYLFLRFKSSRIEATYAFVKALIFLGITMFLFGFPPFFFSSNREVLGWFNVIANAALGIFHAYILKTVLLLRNKPIAAKRGLYFLSFWTVLVTIPINLIFLPSPTFDQFGFEIWNYSPPLLFTLSIVTPAVMYFYALTLFQNAPKAKNKFTPIMLGIAFIIGGTGSFIIVASTTTTALGVGYVALFIGGFTLFLLPFTEVALESN